MLFYPCKNTKVKNKSKFLFYFISEFLLFKTMCYQLNRFRYKLYFLNCVKLLSIALGMIINRLYRETKFIFYF